MRATIGRVNSAVRAIRSRASFRHGDLVVGGIHSPANWIFDATGRRPWTAHRRLAPTMPGFRDRGHRSGGLPYFCRPACIGRRRRNSRRPRRTRRRCRPVTSETSMASRIASTMVLPRHRLELIPAGAGGAGGGICSNALEHVARRGVRAGGSVPVRLGFPFWTATNLGQDLASACLYRSSRPGAAQDEMVLEPQHRIAEQPGIRLGLGPVGRIVKGQMGAPTR